LALVEVPVSPQQLLRESEETLYSQLLPLLVAEVVEQTTNQVVMVVLAVALAVGTVVVLALVTLHLHPHRKERQVERLRVGTMALVAEAGVIQVL
jgi:hypothetical protein